MKAHFPKVKVQLQGCPKSDGSRENLETGQLGKWNEIDQQMLILGTQVDRVGTMAPCHVVVDLLR